jgi:heme/copper-type cytochrome/quinol oxidase subunit 2
MVLPYETQLKILVTRADVIHSWTVPALGVKVDAIPGKLNQAFIYSRLPGVFYGQCREICGALHSGIPISVEFVRFEKFWNWIKIQ